MGSGVTRRMPCAGPGDGEVMAAHVVQACRATGSTQDDEAVEALTGLWKAAYACGVARGQKAREESLARHPSSGAYAVSPGWSWGAHLELKSGTAFRYGGCDPDGPNCDREASCRRAGRRREQMTLADTGERLPLPSFFWAQPESPAEKTG